MQEFKKVTTSEVTEKLTMGQIERIWQQIDSRKEQYLKNRGVNRVGILYEIN